MGAPLVDLATRAMIVTLKSPLVGQTDAKVAEGTGIKPRTINSIYAKAIQRGFDPNRYPLELKMEYIGDSPRSGRPTKQIEELEEAISAKVRGDRYGRELSCTDFAGYLSTENLQDPLSITIWRVLKKLGFKKTKPIRKPSLI